MKSFKNHYWKYTVLFTAMVLISAAVAYHTGLMSEASLQSGTISLLLLLPFFGGFLLSKCSEDKDSLNFDASRHWDTVRTVVTVLAVVLLLVRHTEWISGIHLPGTVCVYTEGRVTAYLFADFALQYPLCLGVLYNNIKSQRETSGKAYLLYIQNICMCLIDARLFFVITASTLIMEIAYNRRGTDKARWVFLAINGILSVAALIYAICTQGYIPAEGFEALQSVFAISVVITNAILFLIIAFRRTDRRIKYFSVALFLLIGVCVIPDILMRFNALVWGIALFLLLCNDNDFLEHRIDLYTKYLIKEKSPDIKSMIYKANPYKVTLTATALSELLKAALVGSNSKFRTIVQVFDEVGMDSGSRLSFDLYMLKALFLEVCDDPRAAQAFEGAKGEARGNVEAYIQAYFKDAFDKLEDVKEDLYEERLIDEAKTKVEMYKAIRTKLYKLKQ